MNHRGTADYGHYTSLINVRRDDPGHQQAQQDGWLEFDDSRVSLFDFSQFEAECFGLSEQAERELSLQQQQTQTPVTSKSAYILFYEKLDKQPVRFHTRSNVQAQ